MHLRPDVCAELMLDLFDAPPIARAADRLALRVPDPPHRDPRVFAEQPREPRDRAVHMVDRQALLDWEGPIEQFVVVQLRRRAGNVGHDRRRVVVPDPRLQPAVIDIARNVIVGPFLASLHCCDPR